MYDNNEIVLKGYWFYADTVKCNLQIVKSNILYGSGDYEDPPEISDDREVECFYIEFQSITQPSKIDSTRGGFLTLSEAIIEAEKVTRQKIVWLEII